MAYMFPDPHGPEIIVGQLQFEFDGVAPLTLEEKLHQWLNTQDDDTVEVLAAALYITENRFRRNRAERWREILSIQAPYKDDPCWMVSGGIEAMWLYNEAWRDYIAGAYFSALICAHAACERELAGCLFPYREELEKSWLMWGLGKLIPVALQRDIINEQTSQDLLKLNELRKPTAHFKVAHETPTSVQHRALSLFASSHEPDYEDVVNIMIRSDALFAIRVATSVLLTNLGFGGPWQQQGPTTLRHHLSTESKLTSRQLLVPIRLPTYDHGLRHLKLIMCQLSGSTPSARCRRTGRSRRSSSAGSCLASTRRTLASRPRASWSRRTRSRVPPLGAR